MSRFRTAASSALFASIVGLLAAGATNAATITFGLDFEFSGGVAPSSGTTPWVTAVFDDSFGGPNTVRLTMSAPNLTGGQAGENINEFYFNFDPTLDPTLLTFAVVNNADSVPNSINTGVDLYQADGDGKFDIWFDFPPPPGADSARFTQGETVIYDLTYVGAISASSFDYPSVMGGGQGTYRAAAHVQRTGGGPDSGWIGDAPEPGSAALMLTGLMALVVWSRRS